MSLIQGSSRDDSLTGGDDHDTLDGFAGNDTLFGGDGKDFLFGGYGDDILMGGPGKDILISGPGNNTVDGGEGDDFADYSPSPRPVYADLTTNRVANGWSGIDRLAGIEALRGSRYADHLFGSARNDLFIGLAGADAFDGRDGLDWVGYNGSPTGVHVDLATGRAEDGWNSVDTLSNIEMVFGSQHDDWLSGNGQPNRFIGYQGADIIDGAGGFDVLVFTEDAAGVTVDLAAGFAIDGWGYRDTIANLEVVEASRFGDLVIGSGNNDVLAGGPGDDTLNGGEGLDIAYFSGTPSETRFGRWLGGSVLAVGPNGRDVLSNIEYVSFPNRSAQPLSWFLS